MELNPNPSFFEICKVWARIGCLSFGGPAGQIALMQREVVDQRRWLSDQEFLSALNYCMLLPGPEAQQLAIYCGWKLHGTKGGLATGLLFIIPGALVVLALAMIYAAFGTLPGIVAAMTGIKAAVLAIVLEALLRVARRALKRKLDWLIAALAFLALFCFDLPFPAIIALAGALGFAMARGNKVTVSGPTPKLTSLLSTILLWGCVWLLPLLALWLTLGPQHILVALGIFFSKLSIVTFGGAYAVLSYVAQAAVSGEHWLSGPEMIDGLGLAETTPGPLILVNEYVGYLAAMRAMGSPWGGIAGAATVLWMTFAPCFLWVFAGAPYITRINTQPRLAAALSGVTAAVVGVILNLAVWFALNVLFLKVARLPGWFKPWWPDFAQANMAAFALSVIAAVALLRLHWGVGRTLALSAGLGLAYWMVS